ncbi:MAG: glycosyltransferase, partial [Candidatus Firestonebacteria bacterium]
YVHVYYSALPALFYKIFYGIPYVITEHSTAFIRGDLSFLDKLKVKLYYLFCSANLPVSADLGEKIKELGVKKPYKVIPNVYDPLIFFPGKEKEKPAIINMVFVGNLVEQKGLKYLLPALENLKRRDFFLNVIGDGPLKEDLISFAGKLGVASNINFPGRKTKPEIAEIMRASDFFVLPSLAENLPCVIIEAFACGLPVLASDVGGIPEIVNKDNGLVFKSGDTAALTAALDLFMAEHRRYDKQKIAAYALSNFSYTAVGKKLSEIFEKITAGGNKP